MRSAGLHLSVITVSHGHDAYLRPCLDSLARGLDGLEVEVLLVDNLGTGRLSEIVGHVGLPLRLHDNARPEGFAGNINRAARRARGRYLLLLNPDTQLLKGQVPDALAFMERTPDAGVLGCRLLNADGSVQGSYRRFPTLHVILARGLGADGWPLRPAFYRRALMMGTPLTSPARVDWVFGAFMLIPREVFHAVGGMDERFRLYYEDVDLCYRLRQRGLAAYYWPAIEVLHHHARTSARRPFGAHWRWHVRSACRFLWKHRNGRRAGQPSVP